MDETETEVVETEAVVTEVTPELKDLVRKEVARARRGGEFMTSRLIAMRLRPADSDECLDCYTSKVERALRVLMVEGYAAAGMVRRDGNGV